MYLGNRWVPMEVMDTILLLWLILAFIIGFILIRLGGMDRAARLKQNSSQKDGSTKKKRKRRR